MNEEVAYWSGHALVRLVSPRRVVVGRDMRLSGRALQDAFSRGVTDAGADVLDIGLVGTEQVYFATWHLQADAGAMITASHNPADYNGMKFVRERHPHQRRHRTEPDGVVGGRGPARSGPLARPESGAHRGTVSEIDPTPAYVEHLMGYVNPSALSPLRVVANGGDGMAGPLVEILRDRLPRSSYPCTWCPTALFPEGSPTPSFRKPRRYGRRGHQGKR